MSKQKSTQPEREQRKTNRAPKIERRGADGDQKTHLVGYAAVFYREGESSTEYEYYENGPIERILPGAFDNLSENDVRGLFNHDRSHVLGREKSGTMTLTVDSVGLLYDITLADTEADRDLAVKIERGDIDGSSFAFFSTAVVWRDVKVAGVTREIRELAGVDVYDVGPVTYPAYEGTSTEIAHRSRDEWKADRQADEAKKRGRQRRAAAARARTH